MLNVFDMPHHQNETGYLSQAAIDSTIEIFYDFEVASIGAACFIADSIRLPDVRRGRLSRK